MAKMKTSGGRFQRDLKETYQEVPKEKIFNFRQKFSKKAIYPSRKHKL